MRSPSRPTDSAATWVPEHLGTFVEQVRDDGFFTLWMLIATSGVRPEALTSLLREEVDFDGGRISPSTLGTTGAGRTTTVRRSYLLDPTAYGVLKEHVVTWEMERQVLRQETQKLFVWSNGEQVDAGAVQTMFRQHCSIAGLPVVPLQAMRQAYVIAAIDSGIPVKQISDQLGHSVEPQTLEASPGGARPVVSRRERTAKSREGAGHAAREIADCRRGRRRAEHYAAFRPAAHHRATDPVPSHRPPRADCRARLARVHRGRPSDPA